MSLLLKQIFEFLKLLNSETETNQIALGICAGFVLGMTSALSLQTFLIIFLVFIFRVQIGAVFVSMFFFKFIAFLLDPAFDVVGELVLTLPSLQGIFTDLYNMPIVPFTRFNNTIVMGSGVLSLVLTPIVFIISKVVISKYREQIVARVKETKLFKALRATAFYKWYYKYNELKGN